MLALIVEIKVLIVHAGQAELLQIRTSLVNEDNAKGAITNLVHTFFIRLLDRFLVALMVYETDNAGFTIQRYLLLEVLLRCIELESRCY